MEILYHAQIGQNTQLYEVCMYYIPVYIDKDVFLFSPQVWGLLTLTPITVVLHGSTKDAEMLGYLIPKFVEQASSIFGLDASNYVPCACM